MASVSNSLVFLCIGPPACGKTVFSRRLVKDFEAAAKALKTYKPTNILDVECGAVAESWRARVYDTAGITTSQAHKVAMSCVQKFKFYLVLCLPCGVTAEEVATMQGFLDTMDTTYQCAVLIVYMGHARCEPVHLDIPKHMTLLDTLHRGWNARVAKSVWNLAFKYAVHMPDFAHNSIGNSQRTQRTCPVKCCIQ